MVDGRVLVDTAAGVFVPKHKRRIGYVFQDARLFPHMTRQPESALRPLVHAGRRTLCGLRRASSTCSASAICSTAGRPAFRRRKAARGDRPGAARQPEAAADGRAAGLARRGAQGGDPALYRAAARRDENPDRLCQPFGRRGGAAGDRHRGAGGRQGRRLRADLGESCSGSTCCRRRSAARAARCSTWRSPRTTRPSACRVLRSAGRRNPRCRLRCEPVGATVRVRIRARDVMIATERPRGLSALNILAGHDRRRSAPGDGRARDRADRLRRRRPIAARITRQSSRCLA